MIRGLSRGPVRKAHFCRLAQLITGSVSWRPAQVKRIWAGWSPRSSGGPGDPLTSETRVPANLRGTTTRAQSTKPQALRKNGVHPALTTNPAKLSRAWLRQRHRQEPAFAYSIRSAVLAGAMRSHLHLG